MPIINVIFIRRYKTYGLKFSFDLRGIVDYIKYGFPLCINGILDQILHSIDKIMIASMLGVESLGFYSIALMAEAYGTGVAKNFNIVIQPHFLEDFGKNGMEKSSKHVIIYSQVTAYFMTILLSLIFICAPIFIKYILPAFSPGVTALRIFLIPIFFFTISPYSNNFIIALEKQKKLIPIAVLSILLNIVLNYLLIKRGYGINGAAFATAISAFISFCITTIYALAHCERKIDIIAFFGKVLFPLIYCISGLILVGLISQPQNTILETMLRAVVFTVYVIPIIFYINKKTGILELLWKSLKEKLKKIKGSNPA